MENDRDLPLLDLVLDPEQLGPKRKATHKLASHLRSGDACPVCTDGRMAYNGMLNLACPKCGYELGGCFT